MFKPWLTAAIAMLILLPACASPATQPTTTPTKALVATIAQAVGCHSNGRLPDPNCTPGVVAETEANIVCKRSTDSVRPPMAYTNDLKVKQIILYGYTDTSMSAYEEDHLIPLELGGDP
ncbi:MAG: hypothetical protein Q8R28_10940, partial [Dehalococcoidia bacterium]|nr:hypothetical protein [Dehalococcoidia bacterium]